MNFLILAQAGFNAGDILFQLLAFVFLLRIPAILVILFFIFKRRNDRLKRMEEKIDHLLLKMEEKNG
ncbi:hypothetical protein M4D56_20525 [Cytobacillus oceanisediminis]|jgi:hypothetical protein|uniref:hypothetical protein n=1 Tax=Cytobacillus TaxID=2675230 RepID=UPI0001F45272|nr:MULTISPECIES: hypothetical protein [Cytobacillus]EFV75567.1 hypothetical protein HMPREF1013_04345 [Bacillus sp. 2_A_57_CT2]MBY0156661.1 hypothetical protein [Cytobacillus firmus]MCM3391158.1 hypothetical protein [Cytobacillus oceanisediminis]MCM3531471.1 hypothetical protein [Cytobacillus oceanisediminis]UQX52768.1 hypothetical protein M5V91_17610 [Cytobacillus pseudoceanisediminis]